MPTAQHTPEPWVVGRGGGSEPFSIEAATRTVALVKTCRQEGEHNASRIVSCVNACKGLNPEAIPELVEAAKAALAVFRLELTQWRVEPNHAVMHLLAAALAKAEVGA